MIEEVKKNKAHLWAGELQAGREREAGAGVGGDFTNQ